MVRKIERTEPLLTSLPLSGQAAFRSKTVAFAFDFRVFFRQLLLYLVNGFSWTQEGMRIDADQCHVDDVQYAAPSAFLRSLSFKAGSSNFVAVLS